MTLARQFDHSSYPIACDLKYWSDRSSTRRTHDVETYLAITKSFDTSMLSATWSASTRHDLVALVALESRMS